VPDSHIDALSIPGAAKYDKALYTAPVVTEFLSLISSAASDIPLVITPPNGGDVTFRIVHWL
jgi:hypothetical protein